MILFPGCKVNLGLNVLRKRADGYHDIETVMMPVGWTDVLELLPSQADDVRLTILGRRIDCEPEKNLVVKAFRAVQMVCDIPPLDIVLQKIVPDGAGLGGGSADAASTVKGLNELFALGLSDAKMAEIAATIGADCPFFIFNRPMLATGTGTELSPVDLPAIRGLSLLIVKPESTSVSTAQAYRGITPSLPQVPVAELTKLGIDEWQGRLVNDFEKSIFPLAPEVERVKVVMMRSGALYSSMSGSGSAVYGIFADESQARRAAREFSGYPLYIEPSLML